MLYKIGLKFLRNQFWLNITWKNEQKILIWHFGICPGLCKSDRRQYKLGLCPIDSRNSKTGCNTACTVCNNKKKNKSCSYDNDFSENLISQRSLIPNLLTQLSEPKSNLRTKMKETVKKLKCHTYIFYTVHIPLKLFFA